MKELRHNEERNGIRADSLKESQRQGIFVDEFGQGNPQVRVGNIARDGKPDWREFTLVCLYCKRTIKKMGIYTNPPSIFCCCVKMEINEWDKEKIICDNCGSEVVRNGTCIKCFNCGNSIGCS